MKKYILLCVVCGLILTGCGKKDDTSVSSNNSAETAITTTTENTTTSVTTVTTVSLVITETTTPPATTQTTTTEITKDKETAQQTEEQPQNTVQENVPEQPPQENLNNNPQNTPQQTQPMVTTPKPATQAPKPAETPKTTTTKAETGLSQSDRDEINRYIKQVAKSYGIGTSCADCNNEGAVILSGNVDPWNGYAWDTPIAGDFHETVSEYKTGVDSRIKTMYNEWINDGTTKDQISWGMYIQVYWEKQSDGTYDLYLMW